MNIKRNMIGFTVGLACIGMLVPHEAHAYIDPGTGGMILQLLLGGVAGALVVGKLYWHRFLAIFQRGSKASQETPKDGTKNGDA